MTWREILTQTNSYKLNPGNSFFAKPLVLDKIQKPNIKKLSLCLQANYSSPESAIRFLIRLKDSGFTPI